MQVLKEGFWPSTLLGFDLYQNGVNGSKVYIDPKAVISVVERTCVGSTCAEVPVAIITLTNGKEHSVIDEKRDTVAAIENMRLGRIDPRALVRTASDEAAWNDANESANGGPDER